VHDGGHLLVMLNEGGEVAADTNINFLLEEFGIACNNGKFFGKRGNLYEEESFWGKWGVKIYGEEKWKKKNLERKGEEKILGKTKSEKF
jgi:hypothetical protein